MKKQISNRLLSAAFFFTCFILIWSCSKDPFDSNSGSFSDTRDNTSYHWAKIGTQIWMTDNLAYLPEVKPSAEGSDSTAFCYVYGYESTYVNTAKEGLYYDSYGALYNWPLAKTVCPDGWHLPNDAEWNVLADFLGGDSLAGTTMKSKNGWNGNGNGTNSSDFNGIPGGYRNKEGGFYLIGDNAGFWTATGTDSAYAFVRDLGYNYQELGLSLYRMSGGFSIRCLKN
jgi:uncharacterized protein (TIGR02145 family)